MEFGSEDPADPAVRTRVLTIIARERVLMIAYFIRGMGGVCPVIKFYPDNWEEVVEDCPSQIAAEILCAAKITDLDVLGPHVLWRGRASRAASA